jgi:hypothetical protein
MSELIVLGLIPGTQIQITFILWAIAVLLLGTGALIWLGHRTHLFRNWLITLCLLTLSKGATYQRQLA